MQRGLWLVLIVWLPTATQAAATSNVLRVVQGQSRIETIDGARQVALGSSNIADVKVISGGNELLLTGLREGMTTLTVWRQGGVDHYLVRVLGRDPRLLADDLTQIVAGLPGIQVEVVGERVMLSGRALTAADFRKVEAIAAAYPDVLNLVEPNHVELDRLVRLQVSMVEISSRAQKELGIAWPNALGAEASYSLEGSLLPGAGPFSGSIVLTSQLAAALRLMVSNGYARTLANPVLVTRNGAETTFHAGGEIPVPVSTGLGQTSVDWKPYGVRVALRPHVDGAQNFAIDMQLEVSDLDGANAVATDAGTIPAIRTRATHARVNLAAGESLVVAELADRREAKVVGRVPGLGHLPILGELFRTRNLSQQETEVYIVITPSLLVPGSLDDAQAQVPMMRYREAESDVRPNLLE